MAAVTKPAVRDAWADNALNPADIVDPGNTYVAAGWPLSGTPPARQYFNWVLNFCSNAVRYFCERGVSDYDPAETYAIGSVVLGDDLMLRQSLQNANTGHTPSTSSSWWGPLTNYVTSSGLGSYVTASELAADLANYVLTTTLASDLSAYAKLASPALSGAPTAPTASVNTNTTQLSTTQFVITQLAAALASYVTGATLTSTLAAYANLASPGFTGNPTAPTAAVYTNTTQLANTNFVMVQIATEAVLARNASNLSSGTVPHAQLPNIGTLPGVTIAADPGTTPSGAVGAMFMYY